LELALMTKRAGMLNPGVGKKRRCDLDLREGQRMHRGGDTVINFGKDGKKNKKKNKKNRKRTEGGIRKGNQRSNQGGNSEYL